jgi:phospholipase C
VPPTPPQTGAQGLSTVPTTNEIFAGNADQPAGPYGLGIRVPMIIVSPWTRGGWVDSQLFDHTSMIRFLEARFAQGSPDLIESNITPWRRAVVGDLTSAFNFRKPNTSWRVSLPDTDDLKPVDLVRRPDEVPVPPAAPELRKPIGYDLSVFGPNGFFRRFKDGAGAPLSGLAIEARYGRRQDEITLEIENHGPATVEVTVSDRYSSKRTTVKVAPAGTKSPSWSLARTKGWYDLTVSAHGDAAFEHRYAGHLEDGGASVSDPGMGGLI